MAKFKRIDPKLDIPKQELEVLKFWDEEKIFQQSLDIRKDAKRYVFYEGPPTANGKPGIHHLIARHFKDLFPRFKTMQGFLVERKAGWDTHGLPVEIGVEKELGLKNKQDIEKYGVAKFNQKAKESVWQYKELWEEFTRRSGYWLDLDNPYITYDPKYMESIWRVFKQIHEKGLLYQGHKVVPYCTRCGTALSSHEVAQGYKEVKENSVYIKFKLKDEDNTYILAWTTTPWTLPGNVALAVGKDVEYVKVKSDDDFLILAKDLVEKVLGEGSEIVETFKGSELLDKEYEPLFPGAIEAEEKAWYILPADFVTTEDGTGVVHTAVMYGEDDYNLGAEVGLPKVHTVSKDGLFLPSVKKWAGKYVKDPEVEKEIIQDLKDRNLLLKEEEYAHDYPFCWRCDAPLLYYAMDSWFIRMSDLRKQLQDNNRDINWVPKHIQEGRFGEWLKEVKDWAISRDRFWGTPLPIWVNNDGEQICIGSFEELRSLAKDPDRVPEDFDPHKPFVDEIVLEKDGKEYTRVPEVIDVWFDSGAMPFAQWHYDFENQDRIDKGLSFPADFICEAIDQTRGWFYTLLAISTLLDKGTPYKNVVVLGHILDKHGKKMSKSKGNVVDPWEIFENYGSDIARWYFYTINQPGLPKNFDKDVLPQITRKFVLTLWNTLSFFVMYANLDDFEPKNEAPEKVDNPLDEWILTELYQTLDSVTTNLENYDVLKSATAIEALVENLSNWYVRRSRKRFWKSTDDTDKLQAYQTLYWVLKNISLMLAPFMPMVAEMVYEVVKQGDDPKSVHLCDWPAMNEKYRDQKVIDDMEKVREVVELGHNLREEAKIKVRQPLAKISITEKDLPETHITLIKDELNVKAVELGAKESVLDSNITPDLEMEGMAREIVRAVQALRKNTGLEVSDRINLYFDSSDEIVSKTFDEFADYIKTEVLAVDTIQDKNQAKTEVKINDKKLNIGVGKANE